MKKLSHLCTQDMDLSEKTSVIPLCKGCRSQYKDIGHLCIQDLDLSEKRSVISIHRASILMKGQWSLLYTG